MKKLYIFLILLLPFVLGGCDDNEIKTYSGPDFVSFSSPSDNRAMKEDGIIDIGIGVAQASKEDRTFSISVDTAKTTAVEGRDFDFINQSVTIPAGKYAGNIQVKAYYDNLTPESVVLALKLETDDALIMKGTTTTYTLTLSRFFEVTMDWICGNWIWTDADFETGETTEDDIYPVTITQAGENKIEIYNVWAGDRTITASVDLDKGQISIDPDQVIYVHPSYGNTYMNWFNGASYSRQQPILGECTFRGIQIGGWGAFVNDYQAGAAFGMYTSFLTKVE